MTGIEKDIYSRSALLLGKAAMDALLETKVIIFGVGGVGSWCAEGLLRSGVKQLTLVDSDRVSTSNCNRQLMATTATIGQVKVEALKRRLLEINPTAQIEALQKVYNEETAAAFHLERFDYIIDAIDSLSDKAHLLLHATEVAGQHPHIKVFSSMGAALRIDPTQVRVSEFWKIQGDPLARALRNKFKKQKRFPKGKIPCVWSSEPVLPNLGQYLTDDTEASPQQKESLAGGISDGPAASDAVGAGQDGHSSKIRVNGSLVHVTAMFGFTLSGLVLKDIVSKGTQA